jgi:murein DD-endopeptidase MepM/ murein hydrolase activator NlpD
MMPESDRDDGLSILLVPRGSRSTRTVHLSPVRLRFLGLAAALTAVLLSLMIGSWWYLAARATQVSALEAEVMALRSEQGRMVELEGQIRSLEAEYERIRAMFSPAQEPSAPDLWLPSAASGAARVRSTTRAEQALPTSWPLTERGFVTQALVAGDQREHPGLDIAIPTDSYIRASGSGIVAQVGEDPVYGRFVVIDHTQGYRTVYAHASQALVALGDSVRQNEVVALSGSTGRSTAPHLHFEILRNGQPVDPLEMVRQP